MSDAHFVAVEWGAGYRIRSTGLLMSVFQYWKASRRTDQWCVFVTRPVSGERYAAVRNQDLPNLRKSVYISLRFPLALWSQPTTTPSRPPTARRHCGSCTPRLRSEWNAINHRFESVADEAAGAFVCSALMCFRQFNSASSSFVWTVISGFQNCPSLTTHSNVES